MKLRPMSLFNWLLGEGKYWLFALWTLLWIVTKYAFGFSVAQIQIYLIAMYDMPLDILRAGYPWNYSNISNTFAQWVLTDIFKPSADIIGVLIIILLIADYFRSKEKPITT